MIESKVELPILLGHLIEEARSLVGASYAALGVLNKAGTRLEQFLTVGLSDDEEAEIGPLPDGNGVLGLLITEPESLRLDNVGEHPESYGFPDKHPLMNSFLGVPVRVRETVYGNLYLTDKQSAGGFTEEDVAVAESLALAAGIAIENSRLREEVETLSVVDDRARIAHALHDRVIQRIFGVGMTLQGATHLADLPQVMERVTRAVDDLDGTITEIRTVSSELGSDGLLEELRQRVAASTHDSPDFGYPPRGGSLSTH